MKSPILYLAILIHLPFCANSQNWQWANQVGSNIVQSYDYAYVITDSTNYYLAGAYSGSIFLQTDTLLAVGTNDLYIIKYNADGNEVWVKGFGGNGSGINDLENVNITYDTFTGSIYLSGKYSGVMVMGSDTLISYPGSIGLFVARMDIHGNFIWANSINNVLSSSVFEGDAEVFCNINGVVYLIGSTETNLTVCGNPISPGGFLVRYNSNGDCIFSRNLFSEHSVKVRINFIDDDIILSGSFRSQQFGIDTALFINNGSNSYDCFIARADSNANIQWINHYGFSGNDAIGHLDVDRNTNNIYLCGGFQDSIRIDSNLLYNSGKDIFISKMDQFGNSIWIKQFNGVSNTGMANHINLDPGGDLYVVGSFSGSGAFGIYPISTSNINDMFLARYNNIGDCLGVKHFGHASAGKVVIGYDGQPVCSGGFFNTVSIGSNTLTSNGYVDVYLAKCDAFTGIVEDQRTNHELLIYANPNQGQCNITIPDEFANENSLVLRVFDQSGKLIQELKPEQSERKIRLDLEAEAKGTYHVTLSNSKKSYHGKLILQ